MNTQQKLQMTMPEYQDMIFGFYSRWCESVVGPNINHYQQVLANAAINHWWLTELSKCEKEFHKRTDRYDNLAIDDYQRAYNDATFQMFNIRPSALLDGIKKTQGFTIITASRN